ncbi:hypothetical protein [Streptomyces sp. DW26H14]|uniref:hypothetical protein n=1 Tax=Streptomyces sp. DW26H14 TaxID=3435395 RepID=UPI00403DCD30
MSSSSTNDSGAAIGDEAGARFARARALAVLRVRGRALAVALLPAAVAVVLLVAAGTGRLTGTGWDVVRWAVSAFAVVVLATAGAVAAVVTRAAPAVSPTVAVAEKSAPDLYRLVRDLAERLGVPAPSAIALTPDCDSWLEDRTHRSHASSQAGRGTGGSSLMSGARRPGAAAPVAPVLVVGSPFLWWMRIAELRAVLAPVVAGTGHAAHPDIAAARRFVRGLDAAVAVGSRPGVGPLRAAALGPVCRIARLLLRACGEHASLMERGVAAAASERAQAVDYGLRIVAQEQVGLAYAGWDRLLTRVALPAWRMGRWPARLDAGVVSALTELSRRDRLAEGFSSRLGERPACDLLEEPGTMDEAASLLAARLFHGGPAEAGPDWSPVDWQQYPEEVVDRKWRTEAARLHRVLDEMGVRRTGGGEGGPAGPTLTRVLDHLSRRAPRDRTDAYGEVRALSGATRGAGTTRASVPASVPAEAGERVSGQHQGGEPRATRFGGRSTATATDVEALLGDPSDDTLPVVPRGLEALEATSRDATTDPDATHAAPREAAAPDTAPREAASDVPHRDAAASDATGRQIPVAHAPSAAPADGRTDAPTGSHTDGRTAHAPSADAPTRSTADAPANSRTNAPTGSTADAPANSRTNAPTRSTADAPANSRTNAPARSTADAPVEAFADSAADALAACIGAELAREAAASAASHVDSPGGPGGARSARATDSLPLVPLQPPRTGRDLLADHVAAMVCCSAVDTAGAHPGLDWLDGPTLLVRGEKHADLSGPVHSLVEDGDPGPLRSWLVSLGVRPDKPVRLV